MKYLLFILLFASHSLTAQTVSSIDIVKVNGKYEKEAMFFYSANWKQFRKEALKQHLISGFELLTTGKDSLDYFHIILKTDYPDSAAFNKREENFRPIMKAISPNGPKLLNEVKLKEFLQYISGYDLTSIVYDRKPVSKKKR